jgi:hypothetical protein
MNEVNHWAIRACDGLMLRIKATKASDDEEAFEELKLNEREIDGIKLSKGFYENVALENYQALLYNCLTRLAGGEIESPESNFTGEFKPAGTGVETNSEPEGTKETTPEVEVSKEDKPEAEAKTEEKAETKKTDDNESKVMTLIRKMDEGDGIYYDDLGIAISMEGVSGPMLDEILDSLTDQGLIYQPRFNHYKEA